MRCSHTHTRPTADVQTTCASHRSAITFILVIPTTSTHVLVTHFILSPWPALPTHHTSTMSSTVPAVESRSSSVHSNFQGAPTFTPHTLSLVRFCGYTTRTFSCSFSCHNFGLSSHAARVPGQIISETVCPRTTVATNHAHSLLHSTS